MVEPSTKGYIHLDLNQPIAANPGSSSVLNVLEVVFFYVRRCGDCISTLIAKMVLHGERRLLFDVG
jgi:hypothetical protein